MDGRVKQDLAAGGVTPQLAALAMLGILALLATHMLLYHLSTVLVPFVLSAFLVLAVEPYIDGSYRLLAGRSWTTRWCGCCCVRRPPSASSAPSLEFGQGAGADEESAEAAPLLPKDEAGPLEQATDLLCRVLAVTFVLVVILAVICLVGVLLYRSAMQMRESQEAYTKGARRLMERLDGFIDAAAEALSVSPAHDRKLKQAYNTMVHKAHEGLWALLNLIISKVSHGLSVSVIVSLYVLFWLFRPLPFSGRASALVQNYIGKKSLVSALYGVSVALLFFSLGIDLAILFGVISFFLNFVPEVGALISTLLPTPVILLDGRLESPFLVWVLAVFGQLFLKFIFSNILEVELIERDREMNIHPVWVMLGLTYFGFIWGPIGMLLSVPLIAMVKSAAISAQVALQTEDPPNMAEQMLGHLIACLEGRAVGQDLQQPSK